MQFPVEIYLWHLKSYRVVFASTSLVSSNKKMNYRHKHTAISGKYLLLYSFSHDLVKPNIFFFHVSGPNGIISYLRWLWGDADSTVYLLGLFIPSKGERRNKNNNNTVVKTWQVSTVVSGAQFSRQAPLNCQNQNNPMRFLAAANWIGKSHGQ